MTDSSVLADIRKRLAAGEALNWDELSSEEQAACEVILAESLARAAALNADGV